MWLFYFIFVLVALFNHSAEPLFTSNGPYALGKPFVWMVLVLFLIYTLRISVKENFFKSLGQLSPILWSRQIGLDLYIGLMLPLFIIYLNEGSLLVMLIWFLPIFVFANLATLLYVALNYDSIVALLVN
jgi:hypothetical protein